MKYNEIQFLRPDPFLTEGITFLRHDSGWRHTLCPQKTPLTKRHSGQILNPALACTITRNDPDGYYSVFRGFRMDSLVSSGRFEVSIHSEACSGRRRVQES